MMLKILYVIAFGLATIVVHHGCATERKTVVEHDRDSGRGGVACGNNVCKGRTYCCNASCGICAPIGGFCTQQECLTPETGSSGGTASPPDTDDGQSAERGNPHQCGKVTCTGNTHCCNPSCGICVPPGGVCTQQFCEPSN